MPQRPVDIRSEAISARIDPLGAELTALCGADGRPWLWNGDPAVWPFHAPLLFPVVGALRGGGYDLDGRRYALEKHGFARRRPFEVLEAGPAEARFRLGADAQTLALYPFAFRLEVRYRALGPVLAIEARLTNPGSRPMPASFGYHPALLWPPPGGSRADGRLVFDAEEDAIVRRIDAEGLIRPAPEPSPLEGRTLPLRDALFEDDALIFLDVRSRGLTLEAGGGGGGGGGRVRVGFGDAPHLGVWTKPGAPFVCVEPWWGHADPEGFCGELRDKPGVRILEPGETRLFAMSLELRP